MDNFEQKIASLRKVLADGTKQIAVVSHANPDGDAVGSALAVAQWLRGEGHSVEVLVPNHYPYFLNWIDGINSIIVNRDNTERAEAVIAAAEIIFCIDFNAIDRLEGLGAAIIRNEEASRVLIDHHLDVPDEVYDLLLSDPAASSTALVVYRILKAIAGEQIIDRAMAEALYVGIMTDTGNFSFGELTPEVFRVVATLVERGLDIPAVNVAVYNTFTESRVRLLGYVLMDRMTLLYGGTAAYIALEEREMRRFSFQQGDSEGFVNYPLTIAGVKMSAMFLATRKFIRVSLRSRGDLDVSLFAQKYFEGGGHRNAAGGKSYLSMEETIARYRAAVEEFLAK